MKRKHFLQTIVPAALGSIIIKQGFAMPDQPISYSKIPPYLNVGDTVGITCPASPIVGKQLKNCEQALQLWGLKIKRGNTVDKQWMRFGGTDEERAADMQNMLDDDEIKAILFGRGGYGTMRMMDKINWESFVKKPKWLVGFSDVTAFHCHVQTMYAVPTIHADMATGFGALADDAATTLKNALLGPLQPYTVPACASNRQGTATGILVGGNLSLIVAMMGSKSALETDGKILCIEDVSEYKYTIDRMMTTLKRSGKLDKLAALVVGAFTATKPDGEDVFNMSVEDIIYEKVKEFNYPVCFHFPMGHQRQNLALKLGCSYTLEVGSTVTLGETGVAKLNNYHPALSDSLLPETIKMPTVDSLK